MAKFNSVLANKQSGKVGDVVASCWRSLKIYRSYVPHIKKGSKSNLTIIVQAKNESSF